MVKPWACFRTFCDLGDHLELLNAVLLLFCLRPGSIPGMAHILYILFFEAQFLGDSAAALALRADKY